MKTSPTYTTKTIALFRPDGAKKPTRWQTTMRDGDIVRVFSFNGGHEIAEAIATAAAHHDIEPDDFVVSGMSATATVEVPQ